MKIKIKKTPLFITKIFFRKQNTTKNDKKNLNVT